jgi:hypothetical protein
MNEIDQEKNKKRKTPTFAKISPQASFYASAGANRRNGRGASERAWRFYFISLFSQCPIVGSSPLLSSEYCYYIIIPHDIRQGKHGGVVSGYASCHILATQMFEFSSSYTHSAVLFCTRHTHFAAAGGRPCYFQVFPYMF